MGDYKLVETTGHTISPELKSQWRAKYHWDVVWPDGESWCYETFTEAYDRINELVSIARTTKNGENND